MTIGWDSRWGTLQKVTAAGSSTTGTYRPYGMDCSGFVDWVFYNMTGGEYIIGHGGGAHAQHTYCTPISWEEAIPGDLVFYPDDEHVGIVCGRDESGGLQIIHCASGANNVVITGVSGLPLWRGRTTTANEKIVETRLNSRHVFLSGPRCFLWRGPDFLRFLQEHDTVFPEVTLCSPGRRCIY